MQIKDLVKKTREELKETQAQFAKRFNTHSNTVSRWENGTYDVPNEVIERILDKKKELRPCTRCGGSGSEYKITL